MGGGSVLFDDNLVNMLPEAGKAKKETTLAIGANFHWLILWSYVATAAPG
jgi:hypothetical protein